MLDIAVAYNRFKFLGDEFLTWLWFIIEQDPAVLRSADPDLTSFEIGNRIVLEKKRKKTSERITIKGERLLKESVSQKQFHRMERAYGPFSRTFTLPITIDPERVKAEFKKGVLKVTMLKRADELSKQIPIST